MAGDVTPDGVPDEAGFMRRAVERLKEDGLYPEEEGGGGFHTTEWLERELSESDDVSDDGGDVDAPRPMRVYVMNNCGRNLLP